MSLNQQKINVNRFSDVLFKPASDVANAAQKL